MPSGKCCFNAQSSPNVLGIFVVLVADVVFVITCNTYLCIYDKFASLKIT